MDGQSGPTAPTAAVPAGSGERDGAGQGGADGRDPARHGKRGGEGLSTLDRLLRRGDFLRCYRTGRRRSGTLVMLYFVPNALGSPRMGITASRKVGNAVVRNRLKRRIREIYRRWPGRAGLAAVDLVVHLKPEAKGAGFAEIRRDVAGLLQGVAARKERGERRESRA